ncbi:MAG TPA: hypothetical protein VEC11_12920 [Allosphingosinicella sp.]|nr:hypothetical protein [Allosphingosinicella sp.]
MAKTTSTIIRFSAALLASAALAACGGSGGGGDGKSGNAAAANAGTASAEADTAATSRLFPDNFKGVCSGASVSAATAYDPQATAHKALYFATYRDDLMDQSSSLPRDWTVLFSAESDALRAIDLVVCARRTAARQVKVCDGYRNNGRPTRNQVRWHTATYELSVREARTGRELAKTTVEASNSDCPMFQTFNGESETIDAYASLPDSTVADFLRPHITRQ